MADTNKFLDYAGLQTYDQKIKNYINTHDEVGYDTVKADSTTALTKRNTLKFVKGDNITISGADTSGESVITISAVDEKTSLSGHYSPSGGTNKVTDGGNTKTISSITVDSKGHVTAVGTTAIAFPAIPVNSVSKGTSVENYVGLTVSPTTGDVKVAIDDTTLKSAITNIQSLIAGGVHFKGVVTSLPASPFTGYVNGDIIILGNKEYILNKPESGTASWVELGDTTAESNRIADIEAAYIQSAKGGTGITVDSPGGTNSNASGDKAITVSLNTATSTDLGAIKIGYAQSGKNYPVKLDGSNNAYVNVPWVDTNTDTKVTSVDNHYKGTISTAKSDPVVYSNSKISVVSGITYDAAGHVTSYNTATLNFQRIDDTAINALFA